MNLPRTLLLVGILTVSAVLTAPAPAADAPTKNNEIEAKESEVQKLKDQLRQRENELQKLRRENEKLRREKDDVPPSRPSAAPKADVPPPTPPQPSRPLPAAAPQASDAPVATDDLIAYYLGDAAAAAARFDGQTFVIRGIVDRFEGKLLQRKFGVLFETPGGRVVRASVSLPAGWDGVFPSHDGQKLVRRTEQGARTLLKRGDDLRLRGRCTGLQGSEIFFDRAEIVSGK